MACLSLARRRESEVASWLIQRALLCFLSEKTPTGGCQLCGRGPRLDLRARPEESGQSYTAFSTGIIQKSVNYTAIHQTRMWTRPLYSYTVVYSYTALYSGCIVYSYTCYTLYSAIQSPSDHVPKRSHVIIHQNRRSDAQSVPRERHTLGCATRTEANTEAHFTSRSAAARKAIRTEGGHSSKQHTF